MSKVVRISNAVIRRLQGEAKARGGEFASPDNILRAVLGMEQTGKKRIKDLKSEVAG